MGLYERDDSPYWWCRLENGKCISTRRLLDDKVGAAKEEIRLNAEALDVRSGFARPKIKLGQLLKDYLNDPEIRELASIADKRNFCNRIENFFGSDTDIFELKVKRLKEYRPWRKTHGERKAFVTDATINRELSELRHAFNMLYDLYDVEDFPNPLSKLSFPSEAENRRFRFLSVPERAALLGATNGMVKKLVYFALHTGMRQSEILRSEWAHLNFETNLIYIPKSKGHNARHVPMAPRLVEMLKAMPSIGQYIFGKPDGSKASWTFYRIAWYAAVRGSEIKNFRFHDLRHTYATNLIRLGTKLEKIQILLGHKSYDTTQRHYAHLVPEELHPEVARLSELDRYASVTAIIDEVIGIGTVDQ